MDTCFGIMGKDFVIVAADSALISSIFKLNNAEDKILIIDDNKLLGMAGEAADRLPFGDWVSKNINLYKYSNNYSLSTKESAHFIRSELAYALRNGPYNVNCILGGIDEDGPGLYFMDYLGTLQKTHVAAHGYGGLFLLGLLDNQWRKDIDQEQALTMVKYCVQELRTRFLVNAMNFIVKIVTKDGIKVVNI